MDKMKIRIGVVSDVVCPWCYIGKRRLEKAMDLSSDRFDFDVEYFPFELNPHMPEEGAGYREYLCRKFGSESRFLELTEHVRRVAAREELAFNPELQKTVPNTRNAHRIIMLAREEGIQPQVTEALFSAYFTQGRDLSDLDTLIAISVEAGLDRDKIDLLLHSNTGKLEIEMAEKELHDLGITSVPLFIIDNRMAISGAQAVEVFTRAFEEVASVGRTM